MVIPLLSGQECWYITTDFAFACNICRVNERAYARSLRDKIHQTLHTKYCERNLFPFVIIFHLQINTSIHNTNFIIIIGYFKFNHTCNHHASHP